MKKRVARSMRRVFLVEDHPLFRQGLRDLLNHEKDIVVCGEAEDSQQALKAISQTNPDLVVVDLGLPDESGLALIRRIRSIDERVKLMAVSMHDEAVYANRTLRAGGDGFLTKEQEPAKIVQAIRGVLRGKIHVGESLLASEKGWRGGQPKDASLERLTDAELEILESVGLGRSSADIAGRLHVAVASIATRQERLKRKLGFKTTSALRSYARSWVKRSCM